MDRNRTTNQKLTALIMSVLLVITLLPAGVFAESSAKVKLDDEHVHTLEYVEEEQATCQNSGMKAYYRCTECDKIFSDAQGTEEITSPESLVIPILDHTWDEGVVEREASPTQTGLIKYTCQVCGASSTEEFDYVEPIDVGKVSKSFKLDGNKLKFKSKVVSTPPEFMDDVRIDTVWIKAGKSNIKLNWKNEDKATITDGVIILRKAGKAKAYSEIKRIVFKTYPDGIAKWTPKTSFNDKTAKKKNTAYSYIVIPYYEEDDYVYIAHCSDWAAGVTTKSRLKNVYKAKLNKKSADLQYKGKVTLKLTISDAKKKYGSDDIRWYSDDKSIAKVNKSGKVTATGVGETTVHAKFASGKDAACEVSVVGAFTPGIPKLKVDIATDNSITLVWSKTKYATAYNLYQSNDGVKWKSPVKVKGTSKKVTGLSKGHLYYFYVKARNDNHGYQALSHNSNMVSQKAVIKRRATEVAGFPTKATLTAGDTYTVSLKITSPDGRKAYLQKHANKKWSTQKTVTLPKGAGKTTVKILFPNTWWDGTTEWRLLIPRSNTSEAYTSKTLKIKAKRRYQNPSKYVQISNKISKHGYNYYVSPVLINNASTRADCIEALIKTANKYKGTFYANGKSNAPGQGVDAPGLVLQACYGAGVDLWPISPSTRAMNTSKAMWTATNLYTITKDAPPKGKNDYPGVYRGDLIFFNINKDQVGHVAIYLGLGKIIHASPVAGKVEVSTIDTLTDKKGKYKYTVAGARRIFI